MDNPRRNRNGNHPPFERRGRFVLASGYGHRPRLSPLPRLFRPKSPGVVRICRTRGILTSWNVFAQREAGLGRRPFISEAPSTRGFSDRPAVPHHPGLEAPAGRPRPPTGAASTKQRPRERRARLVAGKPPAAYQIKLEQTAATGVGAQRLPVGEQLQKRSRA